MIPSLAITGRGIHKLFLCCNDFITKANLLNSKTKLLHGLVRVRYITVQKKKKSLLAYNSGYCFISATLVLLPYSWDSSLDIWNSSVFCMWVKSKNICGELFFFQHLKSVNCALLAICHYNCKFFFVLVGFRDVRGHCLKRQPHARDIHTALISDAPSGPCHFVALGCELTTRTRHCEKR